MFRVVGLCSLLLIAVAFAADSNQNNEETEQQIIQQLQLKQEHVKVAQDAEENSAKQLAYHSALGYYHDKVSCKSLNVKKEEIRFTFFSMPSQNISWNGTESPNLAPYFDPELDTQVLISGRLQSEDVFQGPKLAYTYGVRGRKMNVISVNWNNYSACGYLSSVFFTVHGVADVVSEMVQKTLAKQNGMDYNKLRFTGFGFGAHIAGAAARNLPRKPARITALDPAGFLFNYLPEYFRLQKGDAKFMDTIMTNRKFYGLDKLVGDINFLPSGGQMQNGCERCSATPDDCKNECSHNRAIAYYLESAQFGYAGFVAKPANSWADFLAKKSFTSHTEVMGENVSQNNTGNYYLKVNAQAPFSQGINGAYLFRENGNNNNNNNNQQNQQNENQASASQQY